MKTLYVCRFDFRELESVTNDRPSFLASILTLSGAVFVTGVGRRAAPAVIARRAAGIGALAQSESAPRCIPLPHDETRLRSTWHSKHTAQAPRLTRASTLGPASLSKRRNPNMHAINLRPIVGWGRRRDQIQMDTREVMTAYSSMHRKIAVPAMRELHTQLSHARAWLG